MYGLIKVHKPDWSVWPILTAIGTLNYKLSKFFIPILENLTENEHSVNHTFSFIHEIVDFPNASNYFTASFDVQSLFPNLPLKGTLEIVLNSLFRNSTTIRGLDKQNFSYLI